MIPIALRTVFVTYMCFGLCQGVYLLLFLRFTKNETKRSGMMQGIEAIAEVTGSIFLAKVCMVLVLMFTWLFYDIWSLLRKDV